MSSVKDLLRGNVVDGSGTANYIPKWSDTDTISTSVIYENSGKIGIGTTTPAYPTDINGGISNVILALESTDARAFISFKDVDTTAHGRVLVGAQGEDMIFYTSNTEVVRIDDSGNVGIGATDVRNKLSIGSEIHYSPGSSGSTDRILNWWGNTEVYNNNHSIVAGYSSANTNQPLHVGLSLFNSSVENNVYSPAITFNGKSPNGNYTNGSAAIAAQFKNNTEDLNFKGADIVFYTQHTDDAGRGLSEKIRMLSSGGITFNGDTATANALDDYEEGTWNPVYVPQVGAFTQITMNVITASYVKVGNMVTASAFCRTSSLTKAGGGNSIFLSGLPFVVDGYATAYTSRNFDFINPPEGGYAQDNYINLFRNNGTTNLQIGDLRDGSGSYNEIMITITYKAQ